MRRALACLVMGWLAALSTLTLAMEAHAYTVQQDKPLVIIRFNQRTVYYSKALYTAVSRAVEIKPDVRFSLISMVPATGDRRYDEQAAELAGMHAREVLREITTMGVPPDRIEVRAEKSSAINFDEVHLRVY